MALPVVQSGLLFSLLDPFLIPIFGFGIMDSCIAKLCLAELLSLCGLLPLVLHLQTLDFHFHLERNMLV
jgi:hypothetical protein